MPQLPEFLICVLSIAAGAVIVEGTCGEDWGGN